MLAEIAAVIDVARKKVGPLRQGPCFINFVKPGETGPGAPKQEGVLATAKDWELRVDLGKQLKFPDDIATTRLRPDICLISRASKQIIVIELTVP